MSEHADQFEERDDGEDEVAEQSEGKGYGEDEGERDEALSHEVE
jgi:hypothetical protein